MKLACCINIQEQVLYFIGQVSFMYRQIMVLLISSICAYALEKLLK